MLAGCGGSSNGDNQGVEQGVEQAQLQKEIETAEEIYLNLWTAATICNSMADSIYSAWGYAIYYASDDKDDMILSGPRTEWDEYLLNRFVFRTKGMSSQSKLRQAFEEYTGMTDGAVWATVLCNINGAVAIAKKYYKLIGDNDSATRALTASSNALKELTEKNKESTHKEKLASLYSSISTYYEEVSNPSGSYNSFGSMLSTNKANINTKINELDVYLG